MSNETNRGGVGFVGLLTVLFVGLKLTSHITWSWWWVLSPLWIAPSVMIFLFAIIFIYFTVFDR